MDYSSWEYSLVAKSLNGQRRKNCFTEILYLQLQLGRISMFARAQLEIRRQHLVVPDNRGLSYATQSSNV